MFCIKYQICHRNSKRFVFDYPLLQRKEIPPEKYVNGELHPVNDALHPGNSLLMIRRLFTVFLVYP